MSYKLVGYFENWAQWREQRRSGWGFKPNQIDPFLYTHINYAFVTFGFISPGVEPDNPRPSGDYKVRPYEWNDEAELFPALQALKKTNPALKTLLSLGGWNFNLKTHKDQKGHQIGIMTYQLFSKMVENPKHRQEFISSAINYAREHGFDGVDIDWEYPGAAGQGDEDRGGSPQDFSNFLALLQEFRNIAGNNFLLTIAASAIVPSGVPENSEYKNPQRYFAWLAECAKYLDWINVMTYDYHGAWDTYTGVLAPLLEDSNPGGSYSVRDTIENYLEAFQAVGIPSEKIILGMPTYGRTFKVPAMQTYPDKEPGKPVPGKNIQERQGQAGTATGEAGFLSYPEILERYKDLRGWHEPTLTPYAFNDSEWVSYENEKSLGYKTSYLIEKGLGGAMVWAISEDDFKNGFPLQKKIKAILDNPATRSPLPQIFSFHLPEIFKKANNTLRDTDQKGTEFANDIEKGNEPEIIIKQLDDQVIDIFNDSAKAACELLGNVPDDKIVTVLDELREKFLVILKKLKEYNREDNYNKQEALLGWANKKTQELVDWVRIKIDEEVELPLKEFENIKTDIENCKNNIICNLWLKLSRTSILIEVFLLTLKKTSTRKRWELIILYEFLTSVHLNIKMEKSELDRLNNRQENCSNNYNEIIETSKRYIEQLSELKDKWNLYINNISIVNAQEIQVGVDPTQGNPIFKTFVFYQRNYISLKTAYIPDSESEKINEVIKKLEKLKMEDVQIVTDAILGPIEENLS